MKQTIIHGDCLEVMKTFADKSFDLVLTDPPYGTTTCSWDTIVPFEPLWAQLKRVIKDGGAIIMTASQPFTSALVMSNPKWYRHEWIWEKDRGANFLQANRQPNKVHENVLVFGKTAPKYYPIKTPNPNRQARTNHQNVTQMRKDAGLTVEQFKSSEQYDHESLLPRSIQYFVRENGDNYVHPTQKPVELFTYLMSTYSKKNDKILDPFMGSGTTLVAASRLQRNATGIEIGEKYCKIAQERLDSETKSLF